MGATNMQKEWKSVRMLCTYYDQVIKEVYCCGKISEGSQCPECRKIPDEEIYYRSRDTFHHSFTVEADRKQLLFRFKISQVEFIEGKYGKFKESDRFSPDCILQIDLKSGESYFNMDHINGSLSEYPNGDLVGLVNSIFPSLLKAKGKMFGQILKFVFIQRGIIYRDSIEFLTPETFLSAFQLIRYPELQNFTFNYFPRTLTKENGEKIKGKSRMLDIFSALTDHKSKTIRSLTKTEKDFEKLMLFGPYFRENDHVLKILKQFDMNLERVNRKLVEEFHYGMKTLKTLQPNEKVFCYRLLKTMERFYGMIDNVVSYIADIGRMRKRLSEAFPDFEPIYRGNIFEYHDALMKEERRIKANNIQAFTFPKDIAQMQMENGEYRFELAKDEKELREIGNRMNICVGGYNEKVLRGDSYIFLMKKEKEEVCIEISHRLLVQAKRKHNRIPSDAQIKHINKWAKQFELKIATSDIK
jgi:hypothetical protein